MDPANRLIYASVGNPAPDYNGVQRPGDNLYTDSVVALGADTGKLSWYTQQIAHDTHDWDTAAAPMVYDQDGKTIRDRGLYEDRCVRDGGKWVFASRNFRNIHRQG